MAQPANLRIDVPRLGQVFATMLQSFRPTIALPGLHFSHEHIDHPGG